MACTTDQIGKENIKVTFVKSNKGQLLLSLNGYLYKCNKGKENKKYCGGIEAHDHEPNPDMIAARIVRNKIKERAVQENLPLSMIYEQEVSNSSTNSTTTAILPTCQEFGPTLGKVRAKVMPVLPQDCLFDIPDQFKTTLDGNRFLLMDDSIIRRERILVFSSDYQLDMLFSSPIVYMDGTFSKSPKHFKQIYILHAILYDICLPCVFCLLVNKKGVTYRHIFSELKEIAIKRNKIFAPQIIMSDFETGVLPVIKSEAIFRQIQLLGMQRDYVSNENFRILCRKIMALALMPKEQVLTGFQEIEAAAEELNDNQMDNLLAYFEHNWLSNIDLWNVFRCDTRTNNTCEGYHNRMNSRIYRNHPDIWLFIKFLQNEEKRVRCISIQWSAGASRKNNPRTTSVQHRLNSLYKRYDDNQMNSSELLQGLAYVIAKKNK
ncbi:unnamed protein product [Rotaria sordida]|uniref:MULE transposase domain-containing protein n=1 Tax=Rotaria sordida TaxID=392033 RepID=A0A819RD89_9BILA|nr:unnamed protein product [Rotaria sordida]